MVLSKARKGEIAWILLLSMVRGRKVKDISVKQLCDRYESLVEGQGNGAFVIDPGAYRTLFSDVVDATLGLITEESKEADYHCTPEHRQKAAYNVVLAEYYAEGIRVGKNAKRSVRARAAEIGISPEEADRFFVELVADLLEIAFGIRLGLSATDS